MTMTITQQIITVAVVVLGTMTTRFLHFLIFPEGKEPPAVITYLGTVLPYAVIGLLVVYCLKDVPGSGHYGIPELIAILFIVALHKWKKSTLLSIGGGTCSLFAVPYHGSTFFCGLIRKHGILFSTLGGFSSRDGSLFLKYLLN